MKIKKIGTAQIPKTEGAVIDSFDSGSDERTNAPSIRAVKEKILDIYSTEEVKTNKVWIDGKPIYRVVMYKLDTNTSTKVYYINFADWGIENVKMAYLAYGFTRYPTNKYWYRLEEAGCTIQLSPENSHAVFINKNSQGRNQDIYGIIEYTKTTD